MEIIVNYLKQLFLFIISFPVLSRIWGRITKLEFPAVLIQKAIQIYASHYEIDMKNFEGELVDYDSLCAFFTRKLDPSARPLKKDESAFLSPCDGVVSVLENIHADVATQVKGKTYLVSELVKKELPFEKGFWLATIYLSPRDYHRFHVPVDSTVAAHIHTGWRLFPVNPFGLNNIDRLFIRNERVVAKFKAENFTYFYTAVGATFVGSIKMNFTEKFSDEWVKNDKKYSQNDEFGMFEMGSTIVLLVPEEAVEKPMIAQGGKIGVGEALFELKKS